MDALQKARKTIDDVDRQMAELFVKRLDAVKTIGEYKQANGLPILNEQREQEVIEKNANLISDPLLRSYYVRFLENNMAVSRAYQFRLAKGMKVAYSGVEGAFAHIAASRIFPTAQLIAFSDFADAYKAVCDGECDVAVLPMENSYAGEVGQVMDLMFSGTLSVSGVYELPITHHLLGLAGADKHHIRKVYSHPQALSQCAPFIKQHRLEAESFANTAMAAQFVAEQKDPTLAAIASKETAVLYGLTVLEQNINSSRSNTTRFGVFTRESNLGHGNHFMLTYTVKHEAGALAKTISTIGKHGFNMCAMRSRPMKELLWQYYFYVEAEGDLNSHEGEAMLKELAPLCDRLKVVGCFESNKTLSEEA